MFKSILCFRIISSKSKSKQTTTSLFIPYFLYRFWSHIPTYFITRNSTKGPGRSYRSTGGFSSIQWKMDIAHHVYIKRMSFSKWENPYWCIQWSIGWPVSVTVPKKFTSYKTVASKHHRLAKATFGIGIDYQCTPNDHQSLAPLYGWTFEPQ